ncbi:MAG TPA: MBL fold metallo-hydrolase, partial [Phycisphaerae bacterium]|nr:MBL fold metallo-hydrolase [Phycisphaerae bacterium]
DVEKAMGSFRAVPYDTFTPLNDSVAATFHDAGHILGSAMIELTVRHNGGARTLIFSGDIGEWDKPIIRDPSLFDRADYVVMESTYGNRDHEGLQSVDDQLCDAVNETVRRGGNIIIPTFAIERAQELMYHFGRLFRDNRIPHLLVFLDSPMAVDVTAVFRRHRECMDDEMLKLLETGPVMDRFPNLKLVRETSESKAINQIKGSCIIMAGSGMCNAGRIKHHLANNVSRKESTILFCGYQAIGTLGRQLLDGMKTVRIHGVQRKVKAKVAQVQGLSGHAGRASLCRWVDHFQTPPPRLFITHGEEDASMQLAELIRSKHGWNVDVPHYLDECALE